mgnify:FL=1
MALNPKQERFCEEYLIDLNATQAAIRAGYSPKGAEVQGSRLLSNVNISTRVKELKEKRSEKVGIDAEYVLSGLKQVAERSLQRAPVMKWDYQEKSMVQVQDEEGRDVWSFDSQGANRAFELLGKHIGLFEKDKEKKGDIVVNIS